jgi:predicted MFS family arabinose efflux permease
LLLKLLHDARSWWAKKNVGKEFWTFFAASFFFVFGMFIFFLLYNLYLLDRGFKEHFVGLLTSVWSVGSIVGTVPAGIIAQRYGLRSALLLCVTLAPLIFALRALLGGEASLLVLSFLGGAVLTIWAVCISPAVAQLTSAAGRPFGFSLIFSSGIAVGILGGQIGGHLPGWLMHAGPAVTPLRAKQLALLVSCGMVALAALPISRLRFDSAPTREKRLYPRNPFLLRYLPAIALWSLAAGAFSPFFNVYLSQHLRLQVNQIGTIFSGSQLVQVAAMLLAPLVLKKFGLVTGIMYTQIAAALALASLAAVHAASAAAVIFMCYTGFQWMSEPGMYSLLMNQVAPSEQTGASSLNFLVVNVSQAVAALASGAAFERFGYPAVLGVIAGVAFFAGCAFRYLLGRSPAPVPQSVPAEVTS